MEKIIFRIHHIWEVMQRPGFGSIHNSNTIGIEHVGMYHNDTQTWDLVSSEMTKSSAWLINSLIKTYNLTLSNIYPHESVQSKTSDEGSTVRDAISPYLEDDNISATSRALMVAPKSDDLENGILDVFLK